MLSSELKDKSRDEAMDWVLKLRSKSVTQEDRQAFENWLTKDPEHRQIFERLVARWEGLDRFKGADFPVRSKALSYRPPVRYHWRQWGGLAVAASVFLALGVSFFIPEVWNGSDALYSTHHGQHETINLADGSHLELNSDTEVHVHFNYWKRTVELVRGEAFFSVVHDADHPFVVTAANGQIKDIGTEFDVYLQADKVLIGVQEGIVRVNANKSRDVSANQLLAYNRAGEFIDQPTEAVENFTAWRHGQLVFNNRRLDEVLVELGRYHNIKLSLANSGLGSLKVSGQFEIDRLNSALDIIASTLPITIQHPSADEVVLRKR